MTEWSHVQVMQCDSDVLKCDGSEVQAVGLMLNWIFYVVAWWRKMSISMFSWSFEFYLKLYFTGSWSLYAVKGIGGGCIGSLPPCVLPWYKKNCSWTITPQVDPHNKIKGRKQCYDVLEVVLWSKLLAAKIIFNALTLHRLINKCWFCSHLLMHWIFQ